MVISAFFQEDGAVHLTGGKKRKEAVKLSLLRILTKQTDHSLYFSLPDESSSAEMLQ